MQTANYSLTFHREKNYTTVCMHQEMIFSNERDFELNQEWEGALRISALFSQNNPNL